LYAQVISDRIVEHAAKDFPEVKQWIAAAATSG
jgi:hypothetical protein